VDWSRFVQGRDLLSVNVKTIISWLADRLLASHGAVSPMNKIISEN
jgi:hypothetical protein